MKHILTILILCAFALQVNAQINSGTKYIGGTVGGSVRTTTSDYKTSSFNVQPTVGYFINSNWMIGLGTEYSFTNAENYANFYVGGNSPYLVTYSLKSTAIRLGPTARYYHHVSDKLSIFAEGSIGVIFAKDKQTSEIDEYYNDPYNYGGSTTVTKYEKLRAGLAPGIVYFPTSTLGIELKANIISYQTNLSDENALPPFSISNKSEFNATLNLASTSIGVGFYF